MAQQNMTRYGPPQMYPGPPPPGATSGGFPPPAPQQQRFPPPPNQYPYRPPEMAPQPSKTPQIYQNGPPNGEVSFRPQSRPNSLNGPHKMGNTNGPPQQQTYYQPNSDSNWVQPPPPALTYNNSQPNSTNDHFANAGPPVANTNQSGLFPVSGPVNSSANLQALAQSVPPAPVGNYLPPPAPAAVGPPPLNSGPPAPFPSIPPPPNTQQYRPVAPPSYMGHSAEPVTSPPTSVAPPQALPHAPTQPFAQRSRYPPQPPQQQQINYSQNAVSSQQAVPSYPNSHGPPAGYQPSSAPDGPVGGIQGGYDPQLHSRMAGMSVHNSFSRMWGNDSINLLQDRHILPPTPVIAVKPVLPQDKANCSPDIFRCTLTKIPETSSLLQKSRLPLGVLIHPFKDISHLPVIQCNTIVRCRSCRTYINPFVSFADQRRWKCNLCYRINDLPEEFFFDPASGTYGDPLRRPEIKNATIEFIAPSEYMLRPPQPAIYLFVLDVSYTAIETGYLTTFCQVLLEELDNIPGDARTRIGIITFDSSIHFYNLAEGMNRPHMLVVSDIDEMFVPLPDNLLVNLNENKSLLQELLTELPIRFAHNDETNSALGAALQAAYKMVSPVGGRVTVMQTVLPTIGPGALKPREDPNQRAAKDVNTQTLGPASDFYKKLALDCSGQQVSIDLFLICSQYVDIATLACASKYSAGSLNYYPGYHKTLNKHQVEKYEHDLRRYLTRKIGFEAVMRIRCTRGLSIHTFHGNFFVRSTDLLSLPNVNPDSGFGMQISIEENLVESNVVCFQAAVLYTSSKGERRIRVHTLSLPVCPNLAEIMGSADQQAIIGLLSKMAVDRSLTSSLSDARDAMINACIDILSAFKVTLPASQTAGALMCPFSVRLVPLYVIALLKHPAFRVAMSTKLDERVYAMEQMKTLPLVHLMSFIYPNMYPVHALDDNNALFENDVTIPQPPILQLTFEKVDRHGAYVLDTTDCMYLYVGRAVSDLFCANVLGVPNFASIPKDMCELPELDTPESNRVRTFITWIVNKRPFHTPLVVMREDSKDRQSFLNYMVDDRSESSFSYYEFLQHLKAQVSK